MGCALVTTVGVAQSSMTPRKDAGYVLPDGTVRIVGAAATEGVVGKLNALFVKQHPEVRFTFEKADNNGAISALIFDASAFAPMGTIYGGGIAYSDIVKAAPFSVRIAHGSLDAKAAVSPLAVIVNPANPVVSLSVADVASMYSKQLRARVYTKWRLVGVKGDAGEWSVQPAGLPWSDHYASEDRTFGEDVFYRKFSGAAPVDNYKMFKTYAEVVEFVAREKDAVGIVEFNKVIPGVKVVALVDGAFGRAHSGTAEDIRGGHYPLDRYLYINARVLNGKPMDPLVREYLRLALSPEGQAAIASEGEGYIPLNATELAEEQGKFD